MMIDSMMIDSAEFRDAGKFVEIDVGDFDLLLDKEEVARIADWLLAWLIQQSE